MRSQFIEERRDDFPVRDMCKALNVSPSGYYAWRTRPVSAREMANQQLIEQIEQDVACSENRVARLMRLYHIQAKQVRRYKATTKRNQAHPVAPNLLQRDFVAERLKRAGCIWT